MPKTYAANELYDTESRRFDVLLLRRAMTARGWARRDLVVATGLHLNTIKDALAGNRVSEESAAKINQALAGAKLIQVAV